MKLSISAAARRAGIERKVLYRRIEKGHLSKEVDENGKPVIDLAELARLYPHAANDCPDRIPGKATRDSMTLMQEMINLLKQDRARLEAELSQARAEIRTANEQNMTERAKLLETIDSITRLLTDQRERSQKVAQASAKRKWFSWR